MFATVDGPGTRRIYTTVDLADGTRFDKMTPYGVINKNDGSATSDSTRIFPSKSALRKMAESVLAEYQLYYDMPDKVGDEAVAVTVEIRSIDFNGRTATARTTSIRSLTIQVPS